MPSNFYFGEFNIQLLVSHICSLPSPSCTTSTTSMSTQQIPGKNFFFFFLVFNYSVLTSITNSTTTLTPLHATSLPRRHITSSTTCIKNFVMHHDGHHTTPHMHTHTLGRLSRHHINTNIAPNNLQGGACKLWYVFSLFFTVLTFILQSLNRLHKPPHDGQCTYTRTCTRLVAVSMGSHVTTSTPLTTTT